MNESERRMRRASGVEAGSAKAVSTRSLTDLGWALLMLAVVLGLWAFGA